MKLHKGAYLQGSNSLYPLYDIFEQIHASTWNGMLHGTSAFVPQHKFLLWLYESALIYIALVDGPHMNPVITQQQACSIAQPYWAWDQGYSTTTNSWSNIWNTDVFVHTELFGDTSPEATTYYVDSGFFSEYTLWKTDQPICNPFNQICDRVLKRKFDLGPLQTSLPSILSFILKNPTFDKFLPYIHGSMHGQIHTSIGCAMSNTGTAAMDPLFYMHHTNIDRLWHIWVDCFGYESVPASALSDNCPQYMPVNPIAGGMTKTDRYGTRYAVNIDFTLTYYATTSNATFIPQSQWPTIRQMWSMGNPGSPGWCGLFYRYGSDKLINNGAFASCPDQNWKLVNQS